MTAFISSVFGVLEILILIAIGYFLTARGWFNDHSSKIIAKVVTQVALPAYMIVTIASKFTAPMFAATLARFVFPSPFHDDPICLIISGLLLIEGATCT